MTAATEVFSEEGNPPSRFRRLTGVAGSRTRAIRSASKTKRTARGEPIPNSRKEIRNGNLQVPRIPHKQW